MPECNLNEVTWHPHPYSCTRYILCFYGNPIERLCAPNLHFSRFMLHCTFPQLALCDFNYACPDVDDEQNPVYLPDPDDCSKYFVCFRGSPIARDCAENLWFDVIYNWCTIADEVICDSRVPNNPNVPTDPPTTTPVPTDPPTTTPAPTDPPTTTTTPAPTDPPPTTTTQNPNTYDCPVSDVPTFHPHSRDCRLYFICVNGVAFLRECANRMWFDITERSCLPDDIAVCISGTMLNPEGSSMGIINYSEQFSCPLQSAIGVNFYPHDSNCKKYYACQTGIAFLHECPENQFYDVYSHECVEETIATCINDL
ncbi:CLUMA_CG000140, isoform A [Clunio marinus]|uniref:CLUMA_CG000140, isoform A n=2 Tax=Clunio marinus TaxID=568069 RepID=A0A1J1HE25_9DIPT|nr:CLUMA_CG000140, isoform A [Clunio marinus]